MPLHNSPAQGCGAIEHHGGRMHGKRGWGGGRGVPEGHAHVGRSWCVCMGAAPSVTLTIHACMGPAPSDALTVHVCMGAAPSATFTIHVCMGPAPSDALTVHAAGHSLSDSKASSYALPHAPLLEGVLMRPSPCTAAGRRAHAPFPMHRCRNGRFRAGLYLLADRGPREVLPPEYIPQLQLHMLCAGEDGR
jgi:hypothetical protein